jgi:hypothetical protein
MKTALTAVAWILSVHGAMAAGAIAAGEPADVAKEGLAVGIAVNQSSETAAAEAALAACKTYESAPAATRALCKVVRTFVTECVATAYDPEPSTPGWGYGVGFTRFTAEDQALQNCRTAAGSGRAEFCRANQAMCDVKQGE